MLAVLSASVAHAQFMDLGDLLLYARVGFDDTWTRSRPAASDSSWTVIAPTKGERVLEVRRMGLPGVPAGGPFSLVDAEPMDFTVIVPFTADLTLLNSSDPSLYLAQVGQSWAVYLNGVLLRSEFVRSGSGYVERSLRGVVVPLDKRFMRRGENLLAFHIYGDPVDDRTGFNMMKPYVIDSYRAIAAADTEYVELMLIAIYAFFALYHCVLFALRPRDKGYLYFGTATLLYALYLFARTRLASSVLVDTAFVRRVEYSSMFMGLPLFLAFLETSLLGRVSKFTLGLGGLFLAAIAASQFLRLEPSLYVWYVGAVAGIGYYIVFVLGVALVRRYRGLAAESGGSGRPLAPLPRLLFRTDAGRIVMGTAVLSSAAIADILAVNSGGDVFWTKYAFFVFLLSAASVLAGQFIDTFARVEAMNAGLEREVDERTAALSAAAAERTRLNDEIASTNKRLSSAMFEAGRDMRIAESVQKGFFPAKPPATRDWDVAFVFEPEAGVSRDFYDFHVRDDRLCAALVGAVSGRGIASGLITVLARNVFYRRSVDRREESLGTIVADINRELVRELAAVDNSVACSFLRLSGPRVEYVNAAHTDSLLRRAGRADVSVVKAKGEGWKAPALGRESIEDGLKALSFSMARGDAVLLYTDGLAGGRDAAGREYGARRLAEAFGRADPDNAESMLASIMIDFRNFTAGARRHDDLTAVMLVKR